MNFPEIRACEFQDETGNQATSHGSTVQELKEKFQHTSWVKKKKEGG